MSRRFTLSLSIAGAVLLMAMPAGAHSGHTSSFSVTNANTNAYPNFSYSQTFGANEPTTVVIEFEAGWKFAHAPGYGSEITPTPTAGEQIGSGSYTAAWTLFFCATSTSNLTIYWDTSMTGAPMGAVAHWRIEMATGVTAPIWVIEQNDATDDYKLVIPWPYGATCSTQPANHGFSMTVNGTTASGGHPFQNPSASGCYDVNGSHVDTALVNHAGATHTVAVGGATC